MGVLISNRQNHRKIMENHLRKTAQAILDVLGCPDTELSILLVDDAQIAELNRDYLRRSGPTNVIAFPMQEGEFADITPNLLGDVVISTETTAREARDGGLVFEERFTALLVHGILHLMGYDHETTQAEAARMDKKSEEIMDIIKEMIS